MSAVNPTDPNIYIPPVDPIEKARQDAEAAGADLDGNGEITMDELAAAAEDNENINIYLSQNDSRAEDIKITGEVDRDQLQKDHYYGAYIETIDANGNKTVIKITGDGVFGNGDETVIASGNIAAANALEGKIKIDDDRNAPQHATTPQTGANISNGTQQANLATNTEGSTDKSKNRYNSLSSIAYDVFNIDTDTDDNFLRSLIAAILGCPVDELEDKPGVDLAALYRLRLAMV